jgi:hypothetical protein
VRSLRSLRRMGWRFRSRITASMSCCKISG